MKRIKMLVCAITLAVIAAGLPLVAEEATAQPAQIRGNGVSVGVGLLDAAGDFGFQGTVTSPWFLYEHIAVRAGGFMLYRETNWTPYYGAKLGLLGGTFMENGDIRLYGEFGGTVLYPSTSFDNDAIVAGIYGHFGFEFFTARTKNGLSYFIELGSNAAQATAEKEAGAPTYLSGFATTVGLRFYP
jgi:hypothetical protein